MSTERERVAGFGRLEDGLRQASDWYLWGPYVSERQWGTVREDYSADGQAWEYLPHDHARRTAPDRSAAAAVEQHLTQARGRCRARSACVGRNARFAAVRVPPGPGRRPCPGRS
jgi:hypothetical protein